MACHTTLEYKFAELEKAQQTVQYQNLRPKIQKVPQSLRNRNFFEKQYSPKLVSIGPIHHNNPNLQLGEKYKLTWAAKYIQTTLCAPQFLHKRIADNIYELKYLFTDDVLALADNAESLKGFRSFEEKLSWLLFVDGCSLLHVLLNLNLYEPTDLYMIKLDHLVLVKMDVLLLENQLPYLVLKLLWKNDDENELIATMKNFLKCHHWATPETKRTWQSIRESKSTENERIHIAVLSRSEPPTHLLDLQRKMILLTQKIEVINNGANKESSTAREIVIKSRNIQDLRAARIKLKSSGTRNPRDIDFSKGWFAGELTLPEIVVDNTTAATFLNLIAYEMCPDFENDYGICSFVVFMGSLINLPEDVKELRSEGILLNLLRSDEEVADLFNIISIDLIPNSETYIEVRAKIHKHYCNKWIKCKIWLAQHYHTYVNNPWPITGFFAGFIALALTSVQTWFSIFPRR